MPVLRKGKVVFCNVLKEDDYNDKFNITVEISGDQVADAEAAELKVKTKEYDGKTQHLVQFSTKFAVEVLGADGTTVLKLDQEPGRGSLVNIQYSFRDWQSRKNKNDSGVAQDLGKIQVLKLNSSASEFGDESLGDEESDSGSQAI